MLKGLAVATCSGAGRAGLGTIGFGAGGVILASGSGLVTRALLSGSTSGRLRDALAASRIALAQASKASILGSLGSSTIGCRVVWGWPSVESGPGPAARLMFSTAVSIAAMQASVSAASSFLSASGARVSSFSRSAALPINPLFATWFMGWFLHPLRRLRIA
ncbi:hypothetical protein [Rhizobium sp. CAU 1783]